MVSQRLVRRRHGAGRVPAVELLRVNRAVAALIREARGVRVIGEPYSIDGDLITPHHENFEVGPDALRPQDQLLPRARRRMACRRRRCGGRPQG